jgi:hypothetical protein
MFVDVLNASVWFLNAPYMFLNMFTTSQMVSIVFLNMIAEILNVSFVLLNMFYSLLIVSFLFLNMFNEILNAFVCFLNASILFPETFTFFRKPFAVSPITLIRLLSRLANFLCPADLIPDTFKPSHTLSDRTQWVYFRNEYRSKII